MNNRIGTIFLCAIRHHVNYIPMIDNKETEWSVGLKGLSHEIDFKNFDKNLQNLA